MDTVAALPSPDNLDFQELPNAIVMAAAGSNPGRCPSAPDLILRMAAAAEGRIPVPLVGALRPDA